MLANLNIPFFLLQAHLSLLQLAHVPAGHRRLLRHDVPHQPRVGLGEPRLPPHPPPRPPLPLTQQHLGLYQPGSHLPPGESFSPIVGWRADIPGAGIPVAVLPQLRVLRAGIPVGWHVEGILTCLPPSLPPPRCGSTC